MYALMFYQIDLLNMNFIAYWAVVRALAAMYALMYSQISRGTERL
jgi:hypothetical protein